MNRNTERDDYLMNERQNTPPHETRSEPTGRMKSDAQTRVTASRIRAAANNADTAILALRHALKDATALQGDCIAELIREAAELKRKCARLADVIEQDSK